MFVDFREGEGGRKKGRERERGREMHRYLLNTPGLGIEPAT